MNAPPPHPPPKKKKKTYECNPKKKNRDGQETKASSQYKKTTPQRSLYKDFFFF